MWNLAERKGKWLLKLSAEYERDCLAITVAKQSIGGYKVKDKYL